MLKFLFKPNCSYVETLGIAIASVLFFAEDNLHCLWVIPVTAVICVIGESLIEEK